jgi:MFS family permease
MLLPCIFIGRALCFIENYRVYLVLSGIVQVIVIQFVAYSIAGFQLFVPLHLRGRITALLIMMYNVVGSSIGPVLTGALTDNLAVRATAFGYAMSIVNAMTFVPAYFLIRSALPALRREIERARSADMPISTPDERVGGGATAPL